MDSTKIRSKPNPREKANIISVLLWWWTITLFKTGYRKILESEDLYDPLKTDRSKLLGDRLEKRWRIELENSKKWKRSPSLLRTIFRTFLWEYFLLGLIQILNELVLRLGTPLLLGGLLRYFRKDSVELYENALWYGAGICITIGMNVISGNQAIFDAFHVGAKVRIAVCSVVYRKALRLSKTALGETAPGKVVNLMANDVNRFDLVSILIHHMWSAPLSTLIVAYILYQNVGYAGLIGIVAIFIVVPIQSYTGKLSSKFRLQTAIKTDERVRLMDEIISGVQVIKMYAWEKPFCAMIELARKFELRVVTKSSYIRGVYMTFNLFTTRMALYCTLISMLMFGNDLTADKVFVVCSFFNILAHTMTGMFVRGFAELAECMVAIRRLQSFLMLEEFQGSNVVVSKVSSAYNVNINSNLRRASKQDPPYIDDDVAENLEEENLDENNDHRKHNGRVVISDLLKNTSNLVGDKKRLPMYDNWAINMIDVTAKWEIRQSENTLENINLQIEKGKLYAIIGMVGNGKSSFLSAILGEITLTEGQVKVNGGISYASQEAWVFGATVRQNILFGQPYERQRYQKVVKACALLHDFKQFPQGDQTVVGERGSSLSGGQKARINLARALYRQSDIYLLDDPLSAVDAHVSKHLFQECIQRYLVGKTRILATHQLQYIKGVDAILLLEQGKIKYFSHYQDLLEFRPEYKLLLAAENEANDDSSLEKSISLRRQFSSSSNRNRTPEASSDDTDDEDEDEDSKKLNQKIDGLERTSRGLVKGPIFIKYFQTGANLCIAFIVLLLFIVTQFIVSFNDYFVPYFANYVETQKYELNINQTDDAYTNMTISIANKAFSGGEVGLAITQIMAMTGIIQWGMRQSAEVANQMMAVERVLEYIQLPAEPNLRDQEVYMKKKDKKLALPSNAPNTWPDEGCIKFKNVYMRYADEEPPVLKNLNIVIYPGEKIGIVGRTGAGKSSLISALFRLAKVEGIIEIDGTDTGLIALEDLRRKISIIPQDPVLFSGTLRHNLDPFNEFSDMDLWEALEEVELKEAIVTSGNGLESRVFNRGSNYSVGQRQLVCLARAILRNNRILMLDEATANVDPHTDALIQRTIRKKFATCTMLTVAHRLNTIMDSDKVLVMDKGHMAEYDHPHLLLQNSHSQFTLLVKETGPDMYDQLTKVAKQAYLNKYKGT
ncbi:probable multidrug resistance-associated protein lethal(2)03659 isoform X3 [Pogonomyrmex barbatus]|uniref:Probable multidrug resistance-associated protein lethal(2)03659 isoform X3 n=1 Tax=Pogonomyrmex barbatus TaxID=144034 RepID=A0A6I9W2I1_9HYME|nr:probable multidrug resistance-associated protein lethal(2)03659 isoform X3 [Pogonomyrmex barbatus]